MTIQEMKNTHHVTRKEIVRRLGVTSDQFDSWITSNKDWLIACGFIEDLRPGESRRKFSAAIEPVFVKNFDSGVDVASQLTAAVKELVGRGDDSEKRNGIESMTAVDFIKAFEKALKEETFRAAPADDVFFDAISKLSSVVDCADYAIEDTADECASIVFDKFLKLKIRKFFDGVVFHHCIP